MAFLCTMRSHFVNFLKPIRKLEIHRSDIDLKIIESVSRTKRFMKDNLNIIFTRVDKGNTVVLTEVSMLETWKLAFLIQIHISY